MPKLKVLSGSDVVKVFSGFGFEVISQKESHISKKIFRQPERNSYYPEP